MSSTKSDETRTRMLAGELFDEVVKPLAEARNAAGRQEYFPLAPEANLKSYYQQPILRVMKSTDFEFPGGGTAEGLIDTVAAAWMAEGESGLASMALRLKQLAEALQAESINDDGSVSIFCYTMF